MNNSKYRQVYYTIIENYINCCKYLLVLQRMFCVRDTRIIIWPIVFFLPNKGERYHEKYK